MESARETLAPETDSPSRASWRGSLERAGTISKGRSKEGHRSRTGAILKIPRGKALNCQVV